MAETKVHLENIIDTIQVLEHHFAAQPNVHVGGNLLLYYEEGNPRKHVSPDVFVALGVPKEQPREYYLVWREGKAPDLVMEITSKSTKQEDRKKTFGIYRDILKVGEYFMFDPTEDYLDPPLQGFRLAGADYLPIEPIGGRLPSQVLGLNLERDGEKLRLFDPATGQRLLTRLEAREAADRRADQARRHADEQSRLAAEERGRAEEERQRAVAAEAAHQRLAEENERLRREIEDLRRR
jgi:Uma2 family endonuclease